MPNNVEKIFVYYNQIGFFEELLNDYGIKARKTEPELYIKNKTKYTIKHLVYIVSKQDCNLLILSDNIIKMPFNSYYTIKI